MDSSFPRMSKNKETSCLHVELRILDSNRFLLRFIILTLKRFSVKTNSGQMHLNAAGHEGPDVFAHLARSAQMYLDAVIFK